MVPRNRPHHLVGDMGPFPEACQMQLLHFSAAADIVHQEVGVASSSNESHNSLSFWPGRTTGRSVWPIHYAVNGTIAKATKKLHRIG